MAALVLKEARAHRVSSGRWAGSRLGDLPKENLKSLAARVGKNELPGTKKKAQLLLAFGEFEQDKAAQGAPAALEAAMAVCQVLAARPRSAAPLPPPPQPRSACVADAAAGWPSLSYSWPLRGLAGLLAALILWPGLAAIPARLLGWVVRFVGSRLRLASEIFVASFWAELDELGSEIWRGIDTFLTQPAVQSSTEQVHTPASKALTYSVLGACGAKALGLNLPR